MDKIFKSYNMKDTNIREVAKEIIELRFKRTDTLGECMNKFFSIMKKHNIKQGSTRYNDDGKEVGTLCDNYEWTICKGLFIKQVESFFVLDMLFSGVPKELLK